MKCGNKGFTLIEMMLVVALGMMIIAAGLSAQAKAFKKSQGESLGDQVLTIGNAADSYISANFDELTKAIPVIAGFASPMQPTTAELRTAGYLDSTVGDTNIMGSNYAIRISKTPGGCVAPDCDLNYLAMITASVYHPGTTTPNYDILDHGAQKIGGNGGISETAPTITGAGWTAANPLNLAGLLVVRGGYGSSGLSAFYRRDGSLPLTAPLNMGGNTISGLQSVASGGACATAGEVAQDATGALMSCQSGTWQPQGSAYWKDPVTNSASLPACNAAASGQTRVVRTPTVGSGPRAYTCDGAAWQALAVDNNGNLNVPAVLTAGTSVNTPRLYDSNNTSYYVDPASTSNLYGVTVGDTATINKLAGNLEVTVTAVEGVACAPNGRLARDATGLLLSCQSGTWKKSSGSASVGVVKFGGIFTNGSDGECWIANLLTGVCSCPSGYTQRQVSDSTYARGFSCEAL